MKSPTVVLLFFVTLFWGLDPCASEQDSTFLLRQQRPNLRSLHDGHHNVKVDDESSMMPSMEPSMDPSMEPSDMPSMNEDDPYTDDDMAVPCGASVVCPVGQVCCNSSCGICTPPGGLCIQLACIP
ncbi:hypothetical protein ACA910_013120 [Epithemia clementina (nom. ined.)]